MQTKYTIMLINTLFLLAAAFGFYQDIIYLFCIAVILAALALWFHWYKNIMINRPMFILYVCTLFIALLNLIPSNILLPLYLTPLMLYVLVVSIGIYTTFCTKTGFIGVVGKNHKAIKRASLVLLGAIIISPPFIMNALFYEFPRNLTPLLVFVFIYEMVRRYAVDAQYTHKVE